MRFEEFDFGEKLKDAHLSKVILPDETVNQILEWKGRDRGILTFSGTPGVGKTYLSAALTRAWVEEGKIVRYFTSKSLFSHLRQTIHADSDYEWELKRLCEVEYFILDDIGSTQCTEWQIEILFSFVDCRLSSLLPTLITTNLTMPQMTDQFGPRFASRIKDKENRYIELNWKDKRVEG